MTNLNFDFRKNKPSDIIKNKLIKNGGKATVTSAQGKLYEIRANFDGIHFDCDQLPVKPPYEYKVFDFMVECILKNNGDCRKGNGRNFKLGDTNCDDTTLVGYIAKHYYGRKNGESVYDPVFVLASILEWADIAHNGRGVVALSQEYKESILLK